MEQIDSSKTEVVYRDQRGRVLYQGLVRRMPGMPAVQQKWMPVMPAAAQALMGIPLLALNMAVLLPTVLLGGVHPLAALVVSALGAQVGLNIAWRRRTIRLCRAEVEQGKHALTAEELAERARADELINARVALEAGLPHITLAGELLAGAELDEWIKGQEALALIDATERDIDRGRLGKGTGVLQLIEDDLRFVPYAPDEDDEFEWIEAAEQAEPIAVVRRHQHRASCHGAIGELLCGFDKWGEPVARMRRAVEPIPETPRPQHRSLDAILADREAVERALDRGHIGPDQARSLIQDFDDEWWAARREMRQGGEVR